VLVVTADGGLLASIQCKHCAKYPGTKVVRKWWDSVGIFMHASNFPKLKPEEGSAEYSYKGLEAFRNLLEANSKEKSVLASASSRLRFRHNYNFRFEM
jgi:hypothetical protein